jgi:hypothetical protein
MIAFAAPERSDTAPSLLAQCHDLDRQGQPGRAIAFAHIQASAGPARHGCFCARHGFDVTVALPPRFR